jgi:UDP-glucose 4-epimerase
MRAIVTGGAGFIGSHLVDALLAKGIEVIVLDNFSTGRPENLSHVRSKIEIHECDISTFGSWTQLIEKNDWVFHLAALADIVPSIQMPGPYFRANVDGTFNLLQVCTQVDVGRFIYAASSSCYGIPDIYPTPESSPIKPQYPYALTKRIGEELALHWSQVFNLPTISTRFFNVYGPRSRTSGTYGAVLGVFLAQKLNGKPFTIVGDGEQTRDFTYVTDIAAALISVAESDHVGKIYNVGSGQSVSVNRLAELLGGEKIYIPKRPGEPDCTFADISAIRREIGWEPQIKIEIGINKVLQEIEYWRNAPVWTPDSIAVATSDWFKYLGTSDAVIK